MEDCLFCMIAEGKIPSKKLYEDDQVVAFYDINPQAKVHFLVVPKDIQSAAALTGGRCPAGPYLCRDLQAGQGGWPGQRLPRDFQCRRGCRQTVKHLHFHVLGGEKLPSEPRININGIIQQKEGNCYGKDLYPECCGPNP